MILSFKAQARNRRIRTAMREWRAGRGPMGQFCFFCLADENDVFLGLSVHHILRRSRAPGLVDHPANFVLACQKCHGLCDRGEIDIEAQLRQKRTHDPKHYDPDYFARWIDA